jgi:hypothetical protein
MVFMGADGVEGNISLAKEAALDIAEMTAVGSNHRLDILVQLHGDGVPTRLHIGNGRRPTLVPEDERNVANGEALTNFVRWALDTAHRKGDHSMLVLWGHAYRFGIGHTETRAGIDAIDFAELSDVLGRLQEERRASSEKDKLDIVAFDACDLATVEMSVQLQKYAKYLLASEIGIPLPGWPYDRILKRLHTPIGTLMGPAEFGSYVVRRFCEHYHAEERTVSLTLLDLERASELAAATEVLALRLVSALVGDRAEQQLVIDLFRMSQTGAGRPFVDVADLCLNIMRNCSDVFVRQAAAGLGDLLLSPRSPSGPDPSRVGSRRPFIVEHARNTAGTARLNGVCLYAPHVAEAHDWEGASYWYRKFAFVQKTLWSGLVHALAQA